MRALCFFYYFSSFSLLHWISVSAEGQWSAWSSWSPCSGSIKMKTRTRVCDSPQISLLGEPCEGVGEQFTSCEDSSSNIPSVLFNAHNPVDRGPKVGSCIVYGSVIRNAGNGYDNVTGEFTAPENGVYSFYVQLCTAVTKYVGIHLVANNKIIGVIDHSDQHFSCSSTQAVTSLKTGDKVRVNVTHTSRYGLYETMDRWNMFSGFLVHT